MNTEKRIQELREEYSLATKERKEEIMLIVNKLKQPCYQCNKPKVEFVGLGSFCSEECQNLAYPLKSRVFNISQLHQRIQEFKRKHYSKGLDSDQTVAAAELIFNQKAEVIQK